MDVNVFCADSIRVGEYLEPQSVDAIVTDPPYGLSFRNAEWDYEVPGAAYWAEFLRVTKPGAYLTAFGGTRKWHRLACAIEDAGWELRDSLCWMYGQGYPKSSSSLKPGHEPIILARAPGPIRPLNIDACRIPAARKGNHAHPTARKHARPSTDALSMTAGDPCDGLGRYPPNVLLDEEAAEILDEQSGVLTSGKVTKTYSAERAVSVALGDKFRDLHPGKVFSDSGGASRFMYVAKASRAERTHNGAIENGHSTVKPLALMAWLARLITPPGGCVLDPFCGSGSTLVSCIDEGLDCIGFDRDATSAEIARQRVDHRRHNPA